MQPNTAFVPAGRRKHPAFLSAGRQPQRGQHGENFGGFGPGSGPVHAAFPLLASSAARL